MSRQKCETVKISVVGTGSKGNAYLVQVGDSKLLLDAGIPMAKIRKYNNNRICDIDAMLITHTHNDHAAYVEELERGGVRMIYNVNEINCGKFIVRGDYQKHDVECRGYSVYFPNANIELHYITDTVEPIVSAEFLRNDRRHYWIIECDYTETTMQYNDEHESASVAMRNQRTRETHLSDKTVIDFFKREDIPADAILFVHKSGLNFDSELFGAEWEKGMPKMLVAENGSIYEMRGKKIERVLI